MTLGYLTCWVQTLKVSCCSKHIEFCFPMMQKNGMIGRMWGIKRRDIMQNISPILCEHTCSVQIKQNKTKQKTLDNADDLKMLACARWPWWMCMVLEQMLFLFFRTNSPLSLSKGSFWVKCGYKQAWVCTNPKGHKPTCTGGSAYNEFKARWTNMET